MLPHLLHAPSTHVCLARPASATAGTVCDAAGCVKDEYGDSTDPMGGAGPISGDKSYICLSAPQAYKAGWAVPLANLNSTNLEDGGGFVSALCAFEGGGVARQPIACGERAVALIRALHRVPAGAARLPRFCHDLTFGSRHH